VPKGSPRWSSLQDPIRKCIKNFLSETAILIKSKLNMNNYILKVPFSPALLKGKLVLMFLDDPLPNFCFIMFIGNPRWSPMQNKV
jgi:hypothetical protein